MLTEESSEEFTAGENQESPFTFHDLFSPDKIQELQDQFARTANVASVITDTEGRPITRPSNFSRLCLLIRETVSGNEECIRNDFQLGQMPVGQFSIRKCPRTGLWHGGTIISVEGRIVAYWLIGQTRSDRSGKEKILSYAREIGLDEESALEAYALIPYMSKDRFRKITEFLNALAGQIADSAYQNFRKAVNIKKQKQVHREILKSEAFLETVISTIPDMLWLKDTEGTYLYCNRLFENLYGDKRNKIVGRTDYDFVEKEMADFFRKKDGEALRKGRPSKNEELLTFAHDGSKRLFETVKTPVYADTGDTIGILGIGRDITEQKETRLWLDSFMNSARDGFAIFDSRGALVSANSAGMRHYRGGGYRAELDTLTGQSFENLFADYIHLTPFSRFRDVLESKEPIHFESTRYYAKSDSWFRIQLFKLGSGFAMMGSDITKLKKAEDEILKTNNRWQGFLDSATNILGLFDSEARLLTVNRRAMIYFPDFGGVEDIQGRTIHELSDYLGDRERNVEKSFFEVLRTGEPRIFDHLFHLAEKPIWLNIRFFRVEEGVGFVIDDITEVKTLEAQILQMQKMESIGRLAGGIAHDFNNILGIILGYADLSLANLGRDDETFAYMEEIKKAAKKSTGLVRQLLTFARKQAVSPRRINLNETITGMLDMLRNLLEENIELHWQPEESLKFIAIDPVQVDQVLANLCLNARDAIESSGKITITTGNILLDEESCASLPDSSPGEYVSLSVKDNGKGISEEIMPMIFEPFFTTKDVGKGTGLGLPTIYGIMKQNGGFIHVSSKPEKGSEFKLYFPGLPE